MQLNNIYLTLGVPKIIQHDQGPEFRSKVLEFYPGVNIVNMYYIYELK